MKKICVFLLLIPFLSCKKLVDIDPVFDIPEEEAVRTVADLEVVVNGAYQSAHSPGAFGAALKLIPDIVSDHITVNQLAANKGQTGGYLNLHLRQMYGTADNVWREAYNCINRANVVIEAYEKNTVVPQTDEDRLNLNRIAGEAYFLRGLMHFELVRLWGLQFGLNQNEIQSGVLLRLQPTRGRYSQPRATTQEVYNQVEKDLLKAVELLPAQRRPQDLFTYQGLIGGRAVKASAQGMLARMYFQKATPEDDAKALEWIDKTLNENNISINFDTISTVGNSYWSQFGYSVASSTLFQIVNQVNPVTNEANSTIKTLLDSYSFNADDENAAFPTIYALNGTFNSFVEWSASDRRFNPGLITFGGVFFSNKYKVATGVVNLNVPILRAAELVLSKAEILATKDQNLAAVQEILNIRRRNFNNYSGGQEANDRASLLALSKDQLLLAIQKERCRELFTEGDRLHHFRRFAMRHQIPGTFSMKLFTASRYNAIIPEFEYNKKSCLFKIPDAEIAANPVVLNN